MPSTFRDLRQFATETADPNFSLSVPEPAKQVIRELLAIIDAAIAVHVPMSYWSGDSHDAMYDEDGEQVEPGNRDADLAQGTGGRLHGRLECAWL